MAEHGALPDLNRLARPSDKHAVLQDSRMVAQPNRARPRAQHHPLSQQGASPEIRLTDQHGGCGHLEDGLLCPCSVEAHRPPPRHILHQGAA
jgi:hypothetical protein